MRGGGEGVTGTTTTTSCFTAVFSSSCVFYFLGGGGEGGGAGHNAGTCQFLGVHVVGGLQKRGSGRARSAGGVLGR
jgi:hypothetical protein